MSSRSSKTAIRPWLPGRQPWAGRRLLRTTLLVLGLTGVAGLAAWGFLASHEEATSEAARNQPAHTASRVSFDASGAPVITLTPALQQGNGLATRALYPAPFPEEVRGYASVLDPGALATLANTYASARAQLQIAQAKLNASKAAFTRAQGLYRNQQNISQAELQNAEAVFRSDQAGLAAAGSQLQTVAATAAQDWGPVLGKALADDDPLAGRLIARQDVLIQVTLPPDVSLSKPPPSAMLQLATGTRTPMRLVSPAPRTDPKIRGLSFLYIASAESGALPGMMPLAFLANGTTVQGVVVPASAIVWWQGRAWIYLRTGPETFTRREIPTAQPAPDGDGGYVVSDLPGTAQLVTSGAQALLSEEFRAQIEVGD